MPKKKEQDAFDKLMHSLALCVFLMAFTGGALWLIDKLVRAIVDSPLQHL